MSATLPATKRATKTRLPLAERLRKVRERATRAELGRDSSAGGGGGLVERYAREKAGLNQLLSEHPEWEVLRTPARELPGGAEHHVEYSADRRRVLKFTDDGFGFTVDAEVAPFGSVLWLREALPSEYLARLDLTNEAFGDDLRFEGLGRMGEQAGFAVSQAFIAGTVPNLDELRAWLEDEGYRQVPAASIDNAYIAHTTWWNRDERLLIADAKPKNFVLDRTGHIVPVDLIVRRIQTGGGIDRILRGDF